MLDLFESNSRTFSDAFRRWFGNSKIVNDDGSPLIVYHGRRGDFDRFDANRFSKNDHGWYGQGIYFTCSTSLASAYASVAPADTPFEVENEMLDANVMPCFLSIQNPYYWGLLEPAMTDVITARYKTKSLIQQGYDGIVVESNYYSGMEKKFHEVVAFYPRQVKSIWNKGVWDTESDHISEDVIQNLTSLP